MENDDNPSISTSNPDSPDGMKSFQTLSKRIFDKDKKNNQSPFEKWTTRPSSNPVSGLLRGFVALGAEVTKGVTGVVIEPIKGASEDGVSGLVTGIGKGITGLVARPVLGVLDLGTKTVEGIVNTPVGIKQAVLRASSSKNKTSPANSKPLCFGIPLYDSFRNALDKNNPHISVTCIEYLKVHGVEKEGLFRISGSHTNLLEMKSQADQGLAIQFEPETTNVHDVACLLKLYLREIPEGLIPSSKHESLSSDTPDELIVERFTDVWNLLPFTNKVCYSNCSTRTSTRTLIVCTVVYAVAVG
eukprot:TRINITY_DN5575_c0_g1_i1.p1 TRINITY_DN5575_c0_g1~~TRINITY_DN5575_c0_g1_i1.p1  ORF type:complete len:308 (-),score=50.23 TRINITY_DN5575_c0_g1_i1:453-1355(-)